MGNHKLIVVRWASAALTAACWAYALVSRFTSFFLAHRTEKMLLLAAVAAVTGLISLFFFHILLSRITTAVRSKVLLRTAALSMLAAAVLLLFILPPLHFPENHLLEIKPHSPEGGLTILSVHRYEMPRRELLDVPPSKLDLIGGWHTDTGSDVVTWTGGADAAIRYERLMQAGIQLVFRSGPGEGGALISWDGEEHIINLHAQVEGKENILLMPALTWRDADLTRKLLVGVARESEFLGLSALICMLVLLPRVLKLRGTSAILIIASVLLLLMPLVHAADPPVEFRDPQLEAAVRDALGQPEGAIRQHKVQTIARLFASGYGITDLEGIQHLRNLASLNLRDNEITNINLLRHFYTLRELNLRKNNIHDLEPLRNLTGLVYLNIHSNPVDQGLDVLANLVDLETLIMRNVHIGNDHQFLMRLIGLKNLNIRNTSISDLSAIAVLMKSGTLQDDINSGTIASLNILENDPLPVGKGIDPYGILIPYWDNITYRYPVSLPYFPRDVDPPVFSQESGFYESGFYLTLSAGESGGSIYYTLDGSDPSLATQNDSGQSTKKYDSPILIQNRVGDSNQLANIYTSQSPVRNI